MENVTYLVPMLSVGTSQSLVFISQMNIFILLGEPVLPTWKIGISTWLQSERFLSITVYILLPKALNNICS
jgi:hypothetical protein